MENIMSGSHLPTFGAICGVTYNVPKTTQTIGDPPPPPPPPSFSPPLSAETDYHTNANLLRAPELWNMPMHLYAISVLPLICISHVSTHCKTMKTMDMPQFHNNNNNNINCTERRNLRLFFTISSLRPELSPTHMLVWPRHKQMQITCST